MRTSKLYLAVCAAALCGSIVAVRADNTPAQAAALAALEAKMHELNAQSASTNIAQTPAMPEQPAHPAATTAPATPAPVAVTHSGAAKQKPSNPPAVMATAPSTPPPAAPRTVASTSASSNHGLFAPVPPPSGGATIQIPSKQNERPTVTHQTAPAHTVPTIPPAAFVTPPQHAKAAQPGKTLGLKPITAPPLPISAAQEAQLQALLQKYEGNLITPEQYQARRAKILAEPK